MREFLPVLAALALLWAAAWALSGCALAPSPVYDHALADGVRDVLNGK